jgi:SNF2 family DNA or RNA helicase
MMTGTPAAQSPIDAYGLAKLVSPQRVPKYLGSFRDLVMQRVTTFKWAPRPNATKIVHSVLQPAIRFTKEQCLDLPPQLYVDRDAPLTQTQETYYKRIKKDMLAVAAGEVITATNAAALVSKLLQISAGAAYTDKGDVIEFDIASRFNVLREVIDETEHKVILFVNFRGVIQLLKDKLAGEGYSVDCIYGDVPAATRTAIFNRFQTTPDPKILIIQPQSAAHGVTLHAADTVVWWGPITSAETYLQGNARAHRAGQTKSVTVVHLSGSEAEGKISTLCRQNIDVHERIVDLYEEIISDGLDSV